MKKVFVLTLIFLVILTITMSVVFRGNQPVSLPNALPTPTPVGPPHVDFSKINYSKVFPDQQAAQEVLSTLQVASESSQIDDYTVVPFQTDIDQRQNLVYEKNNTAQYVVQEKTSDNTDLMVFLASHPGSQSFQMFDSIHAGSGFSWYIFPQDGVGFLANKDFGYALKVLYFPKTTKENFIQTAAKTFQLLQDDPNSENVQESFPENP
ncbi:MAG TPA: hypothetical protein VEW42_02830 [Candidatus Eisenbacteria bacterium]|nr:hypothetical protein [Candidatus Eisenbacteria bacterium]